MNSPFITCNVQELTSKYLVNTGISKSAKIIDIAAGTGLAALRLRQDGFTGRIDAVDGCQAMLDKAKESDLYTELICCKLGDGTFVPVGDSMFPFDKFLEIGICKDVATLVIYFGIIVDDNSPV